VVTSDDAPLHPAQQQAARLARRRSRRRRLLIPWLFAAPALLLHICVIAIPSLFTYVVSFCSWNGIGPLHFVGLSNYQAMFSDTTFGAALLNNVKWMVMYLTIPIAMALGAAVLIGSLRRPSLQLIYRSVFFLPATVAGVVVARIWSWIYHPFFGMNEVLHGWGWNALALNWLSDPNIALYSVAIADNWRWWGFLVIIFLAALQQVDHQLYESARIDGANRWQLFWYITIPSLRPTLLFVVLTSVIFSFLVLELIYLMTSGGPGTATQVTSYWIYSQAIYNFSYGYASALAVVLTLMLLVIISAVVFIQQRRWQE
jgi:raffinose/stachyose/melibiose transport system permease protein